MCNRACPTTYINNRIYGGCNRPVVFNTYTEGNVNWEPAVILTSEYPFFDPLQMNYDDDYRNFTAVFAFNAPFGSVLPVYLQDGCNGPMIPLRSASGGFTIQLDQIQSLCNARKLVSLLGCYDGSNDHVNILTKVGARHKTTTPTATPTPTPPAVEGADTI